MRHDSGIPWPVDACRRRVGSGPDDLAAALRARGVGGGEYERIANVGAALRALIPDGGVRAVLPARVPRPRTRHPAIVRTTAALLVVAALSGCGLADSIVGLGDETCRCVPGEACTVDGCLPLVLGGDGREHIAEHGATLCGAEVVGVGVVDEDAERCLVCAEAAR